MLGQNPHPMTAALLSSRPVSGALMGAGDVIAQQLVEQRGLHGHHSQRTLKMTAIGFCFVVSADVGGTRAKLWCGQVAAQFCGLPTAQAPRSARSSRRAPLWAAGTGSWTGSSQGPQKPWL